MNGSRGNGSAFTRDGGSHWEEWIFSELPTISGRFPMRGCAMVFSDAIGDQEGGASLAMSTTQRHSPSASRRQMVMPRVCTVIILPFESGIAISAALGIYAIFPSAEKTGSFETQWIWKPGVFRLSDTNLRIAALPWYTGCPGSNTCASSDQYERTLSMSFPSDAAWDHSASRRRSFWPSTAGSNRE